MDLLEYQGKQYLSQFGVPTPEGRLAATVDEAVEACCEIGYPAVLKAQVRVGGRGKAGGIRIVTGPGDAQSAARDMLGSDLKGHLVDLLWCEPASDVRQEHYASFSLDRSTGSHLAMVSAQGGVEVEELARERPEAIARRLVDPVAGLDQETAAELLLEAGIAGGAGQHRAVELLSRLYACYRDGDAELVEVNPLAADSSGRLVALDAKVTLDDNAAFRHPDWDRYREGSLTDRRERMAALHRLNYVGLDGQVGVIANGAGLAMATLDVVHRAGGRAANFLDIGGGASAAVMAAALDVIASDPSVRSILVNVFGGITRCDEVAKGMVEAMAAVPGDLPVVLRLEGTNAEQGRAVLSAGKPGSVIQCESMDEAAALAVELAGRAAA